MMEATDNANAQTQSEGASLQSSKRRKLFMVAVNGWLIFHLMAITIAPASVSPSSELFRDGWRFFRPYLQAMYLNHGYHFFAPEPAASTLLAYTIEKQDGSQIQGRIPNRQISPRLLYHRHFMLTEFLSYVSPEIEKTWHRSYARHLTRRHDAQRVSLTRVTHFLPTMQMVREGVTLDVPESYTEQPLGAFECDEF